MKKALVVLLVLAAAGAAVWWFFLRSGGDGPKVRYRTAKADRGEVVEGVAASGTVQPVELIQVGTQISGTIQKLFADFNSKVKAGQTIAQLDARRLEAQVAQDEASLSKAKADVDRVRAVVASAKADADKARAAVGSAEAEVSRVDALLVQARADLARQRQLFEKRITAQGDVDAAVAAEGSLVAQRRSAAAAVTQGQAAVVSAEAAVAQQEAQTGVAQAAVAQADAALLGDRVNLGYATIVSPVDGVVVSRSVDVGQTVAASLSAPTLFTIARDLTKIHVETAVPEADIGRVREKQPATFTVDAHPDRTFPGTVSQVRLASTTVQNVVTYIAVVDASNPEGLLFPGMTANVVFEVERSAKDALRVPATALRVPVTPDLLDAASAAAVAKAPAAGPRAGRPPRGPGGRKPKDGETAAEPGMEGKDGEGGERPEKPKTRPGTVYLLAEGNRVHAVAVRVGISDGVVTVVTPVEAGTLKEGDDVVTAVLKEEEPSTTNPFAPPRMGGGRPGAR